MDEKQNVFFHFSSDDSKSPSSTEKTSLLSKRSRRSKRNKSSSSEDSEGERSDTKDLGYKHGDYSSNLTGSLSNINLAAEESSPLITGANNVGTDREVTSSPGKADSPEAQKQKTKLKKKRLAAFQKASIVTLPFTTDDTGKYLRLIILQLKKSRNILVYISLSRYPSIRQSG